MGRHHHKHRPVEPDCDCRSSSSEESKPCTAPSTRPCSPPCCPGPKGDKGDKGCAGPKGDKGCPGPKGDTGLKGEKGDIGPPGRKGCKGDCGGCGEKGCKGDKGCPGEKGEKGCHGEKGDKGCHGEKGCPGEKGEKGCHGEKGEKGDRGCHGEKGEKGDHGCSGERGRSASPGPRGEKGCHGPRGEKGCHGPPGPMGPPAPIKTIYVQATQATLTIIPGPIIFLPTTAVPDNGTGILKFDSIISASSILSPLSNPSAGTITIVKHGIYEMDLIINRGTASSTKTVEIMVKRGLAPDFPIALLPMISGVSSTKVLYEFLPGDIVYLKEYNNTPIDLFVDIPTVDPLVSYLTFNMVMLELIPVHC